MIKPILKILLHTLFLNVSEQKGFRILDGPNLDICDVAVNEAMNLFWNNKGGDRSWHFFGTSDNKKLKHYDGDSEVLHKILNKKN